MRIRKILEFILYGICLCSIMGTSRVPYTAKQELLTDLPQDCGERHNDSLQEVLMNTPTVDRWDFYAYDNGELTLLDSLAFDRSKLACLCITDEEESISILRSLDSLKGKTNYLVHQVNAARIGLMNFHVPVDDSAALRDGWIVYPYCPKNDAVKRKWRLRHLSPRVFENRSPIYYRLDINLPTEMQKFEDSGLNFELGLRAKYGYLGAGLGDPGTYNFTGGGRLVFWKGTELRVGGIIAFRKGKGYDDLYGSVQVYPFYASLDLRDSDYTVSRKWIPVFFGTKFSKKRVVINAGLGIY